MGHSLQPVWQICTVYCNKGRKDIDYTLIVCCHVQVN